MQVDPNVLTSLIQQYGVMGIMFVVLLGLYLRQNKRMAEIEDKNDQTYQSIIKDYVELVQKNITAISMLTGCIGSIKDAIERIDKRSQD
jgi:hypothetical protein